MELKYTPEETYRKTTFKILMEQLVAIKKKEEKLNAIAPEINIFSDYYEDIVVNALEFAMSDEETQWISHWLYACDMGRDEKETNSVETEDGKKIPFKTLNNLYDCIKNN